MIFYLFSDKLLHSPLWQVLAGAYLFSLAVGRTANVVMKATRLGAVPYVGSTTFSTAYQPAQQ